VYIIVVTLQIYNNHMNTLIDDDNTNEENENEPLGLLSIAIDVIDVILTKFLTIKDVGNLDTAYCSKKKRCQFLRILSDESIVYDHLYFRYSFRSINTCMIWIGIRRINIMALSMTINKDVDAAFYLSDKGLLGLSRHCNQLQSLSISKCGNITIDSVIEIIKNCYSLRSLDICSCGNITTTGMIEIGSNCSSLQSLDISNCSHVTDAAIIAIGKNCTNLRSLNIRNCTKVTDTGMIEIGRNCINLRSLHILNSEAITDVSIIEISKNCTQLRDLSINGNNCLGTSSSPFITAVSMYKIAECISTLQSLCLSCAMITADSLVAIIKNSSQLQSLEVEGCPYFNNKDMIEISKYARNLQSLCLSYLPNISDASLFEIGKNCINLQSLSINRCGNISKLGIIHMEKSNLKSLNVWGCRNIANYDMTRIKEEFPNISINLS